MKVIHFCNSFSPLTETFIYDYITELENQGIDNYVVTFNRVNEEERPFDKVFTVKVRRDFLWLILRSIAVFNNKPSKAWAIKRRELRKVIREIEPDIIHAHFGPQGVIVGQIANRLDIPLVVSFHGYDASILLRNDFWINRYEELNNIAKFIIVVSNYMASSMKIFDPSKIRVVHVGKKMKDYAFDAKPNGIKKLLSIGRLIEKKGYFDLIAAFDLIKNKYPDLRLEIVGDGPLKNDLRNAILKCRLDSRINLTGAMNHSSILERYQKADAFILTSRTTHNGDTEGIPTVLMEAQAIGIPVISTRHSGIPEVIPKENHVFLAEEGSIEEIKNCLVRLMETGNHELESIIKRARKKMELEFNIETEVKKLIRIYESAKNNS